MRYFRLSLIVLMIAAAGYGVLQAYSFLKIAQSSQLSPSDVIPENAMLIYESDKILEDWRKLNTTNVLWEEAKSNGLFNELNEGLNFLDSILISDPKIETLLNDRLTSFSVHFDNKELAYLFICQLNLADDKESLLSSLEKVFPKTWNLEEVDLDGETFVKIQTNSTSVFLGFYKNLLVVSPSEAMIQQTLNPKSNDFSGLFEKRGSGFDVHGNLLINFKTLHLYLKKHLTTSPFASNFLAGKSISDISVKAKAIALNGISVYENNPIGGKLKTLPLKGMELHNYVPSTITSMVRLSIPNDFKSNTSHFSGITNDEIKQRISATNARLKTNINEQLFGWLGDELAIVRDKKLNHVMVIKTDAAISSPDDLLLEYSQNALASQKETIDTFEHAGFVCFNSYLETGYENYFGLSFQMNGNVWFAVNSKYVLISRTAETLKQFISSSIKESFAKNEYFNTTLETHFGKESAAFVFAKPFMLKALLSDYLNNSQMASLDSYANFTDHIKFVGLQCIPGPNHISHNFLIAYHDQENINASELWNLAFESTLKGHVQTIFNHRTKSVNFVVQDASNKIHLLSPNGKLIWSKEIKGPIIGDIQQVDIYDNDKLQMVFNTNEAFYVIDILGRDLKSFPKLLKSKSTAPLAIYDYVKNKDYRYIIPSGKRLLNFGPKGDEVSGWEFESAKADLVHTPIHALFESKDFIITHDSKGNILYLNRRGERQSSKELNVISSLSKYSGQGHVFFEKSNELVTSKFIYVDTNNRLISTYLGGARDSIDLIGFDANRDLFMYDINGDNTSDYIIKSRNKVLAYGKDKSILINFKTEHSDHTGIVQYKSRVFFTYTDTLLHELVIIDNNGDEISRYEDASSLNPIIGDFNEDGNLEVVYQQLNGILRSTGL